MAQLDPAMGHLLRRAGFGASQAEAETWNALSIDAAIDRLVDFEQIPDDVDTHIGTPGYLGTVSEGPFTPHLDFVDALQRWIFRMVHTQRPLQEKMALFWHNHFATGYGKVAGQLGEQGGVRALFSKPSEDVDGLTGQLEMFRTRALGNFGDLLLAVAQDPAMVAWLDGDSNFKDEPQENFARELMELYTVGVGQFTEADVHAGARVFTGWNLSYQERSEDDGISTFNYDPLEHDPGEKTFSFPIYPDGSHTIPARDPGHGAQDGLDLIRALAAHPATGPRLARRLYGFFVTDQAEPDAALIDALSATYYAANYDMRQVVRQLFRSSQFQDPRHRWVRYSWPAEYAIRLTKEVGWVGFSADNILWSMLQMGQFLYQPPTVAGWPGGSAWFSTTTMLSRMNFAAWLTWVEQFELQRAAQDSAESPDALLAYYLDRLSSKPFSAQSQAALRDFILAFGRWTGSPQQVRAAGAGVAHLIGASGEYQFV